GRPDDDARGAGHRSRSRRGGLSPADLHAAGPGSADVLLRDHRAARLAWLRRRQLQGAVRGDRARTGEARQPLDRPPAQGGFATVSQTHVPAAADTRPSTNLALRHAGQRWSRRAGALIGVLTVAFVLAGGLLLVADLTVPSPTSFGFRGVSALLGSSF